MIYKRLRHFAVTHRSTLRSWVMTMKGIPCFIIGNGPSLSDQPIHKLNDYFTIGINRSFRAIDTSILLWQDVELWVSERKILPKLNAIKYCRDVADPENIAYHFRLSTGAYKLPKDPLLLHGRGSTGPLAFQLAYLLGCDPIILLGYDCAYRGDQTDFWGKNRFHKPHTLVNCQRGLDWIRKVNENEANRTIINCSENTIFDEQVSLDAAIERVKDKYPYTGQDFFVGLLFGLANSAVPDPSLAPRKKNPSKKKPR